MDAPKTAQAAPASDNQLHFLDYWRIIRIRKTVILAVFLLVVLTTTAVTFVLPQTYSSTARIAVEKDTSDIPGLFERQSNASYDPYFIQTEFERIQSKSVLHDVIGKLDLNNRWAKENGGIPLRTNESYMLLKRRIDVRQSRNTSLIEIRAFSEDRQEAAELANTIAQVYKENRISVRKDMSSSGILSLKGKYEEQEAKVQKLQKDLSDLRTSLGISDYIAEGGGPTSTLEPETVRRMDQERISAEHQFSFFDSKVRKLKELDKELLPRALLTSVNYDQTLATLLSTLNEAEQKYILAIKEYTELHTEVQKLAALIKKVREQIDLHVDGIMKSLESQAEAYKAHAETMATKLAIAKTEDAKKAAEYRPYLRVKQDLETEKQILTTMKFKLIQEEVDLELPKTSVVQITDVAEAELRPVRPNVTLNITLGVIVGLIVGVGLAFFIEYLDTSVKTIDDVERALQAPVLGVIPQNIGHLINEGPDNPHAEAYRVLRTNVLFSRKDPKLNTITVVSGGAGEGKSTTIFNLATIFAQSGQRVLVVDSDLRRPSLHKILNIANSVGLTNYLLKQNTLEEVIQVTKQPGLDFLPSGKLPSSSLGILNSSQMREFIREVKARYDFVFFDSPPIMGVSDASILASEVDMALLVVQYRKYPQAMTVRAKQMVEKVGGRLMGVVLNNINISQDSYYYYYSGYYYDYYSKKDEADSDSPRKNGEQGKESIPGAGSRSTGLDIKKKY